MKKIVALGLFALLLMTSVPIFVIGSVRPQADGPPPDFPDPTSALLPDVVGQEAWDKYDKEWTEKLKDQLVEGEPIPLSGLETTGSTIIINGEPVKLPDNMYVSRYTQFMHCSLDVCGEGPWYDLRRVEGSLELVESDAGELHISSNGLVWYGVTVPPEIRYKVDDGYGQFVEMIGSQIEDKGYAPAPEGSN